MAHVLPDAWESWYRFALDELELENGEAAEYANVRYVEDENRARRRARPERIDRDPEAVSRPER